MSSRHAKGQLRLGVTLRLMRTRPVLVVVVLVLTAFVATGTTFALLSENSADSGGRAGEDVPPAPDADDRAGKETPGQSSSQNSQNSVQRACALSPQILARIWRGFDRSLSTDVTVVPKEPNFWGSFFRVSHTGPWDYLQRVPLVLYGPGRINESGGPLQEHVNINDVYATVGELLDVELPTRNAEVLESALVPDAAGTPKLVVVLMWDGVGRNVLERWPDRWPDLARLERDGTSYYNASVGSSPSVTPSTHSSLGTGAFPRSHKMIAIDYRGADGEIHSAFERSDPRQLKLTTFADEIDLTFGNEPKVGMLAWSVSGSPPTGPDAWITNHLGMLGHGTATSGGDADHEALIGDTGNITANPRFYSLPRYLEDFKGLKRHADELDRADGEADDRWMGHEILKAHNNPAWVNYQTDILTTMLTKSHYGDDDIPDLFFANIKPSDTAGHAFTIDSEEVAAVVEAQDAALGELVDYLDQEVGDYVLIMSSDHGHTGNPRQSGAWPVNPEELKRDLNNYFPVPEGRSIVQNMEAVGVYVNRDIADDIGVETRDIAQFLNSYTIRANWAEEKLPKAYAGRGQERVLSAAFTKSQFPRIMECAFGSKRPPPDLDA
jgi:hypothetical protein